MKVARHHTTMQEAADVAHGRVDVVGGTRLWETAVKVSQRNWAGWLRQQDYSSTPRKRPLCANAPVSSVVRQEYVQPLPHDASPHTHEAQGPLEDAVLDAQCMCQV